MHKTIMTLFNRDRLYIFRYLCRVVLINILLLTFFVVGIGYSEPRFSITSNNEPLYNTLAKISKVTGYQIEITKGWKNKSLTADLNKVTLEESMKAIIRSLGRPNYIMIVDERRKKVEIRIIDDSSTGKKEAKDVDVITKTDSPDGRNPQPEDAMGEAFPERESREMEMK